MNQVTTRKKNSLSAFKTVEPTLLKPVEEKQSPPAQAKPVVVQKQSRAGEVVPARSKAGRKAKKAGQKEIHQIGLRFNDAEFDALQKNAGLIPIATLIKDYLRKNSDLLK